MIVSPSLAILAKEPKSGFPVNGYGSVVLLSSSRGAGRDEPSSAFRRGHASAAPGALGRDGPACSGSPAAASRSGGAFFNGFRQNRCNKAEKRNERNRQPQEKPKVIGMPAQPKPKGIRDGEDQCVNHQCSYDSFYQPQEATAH